MLLAGADHLLHHPAATSPRGVYLDPYPAPGTVAFLVFDRHGVRRIRAEVLPQDAELAQVRLEGFLELIDPPVPLLRAI